MLIDVGLDVAGIHTSTLATRIVSGGFFGLAAAFLLGPIILESIMLLRLFQPSQQEPSL